MTDVAVRPEPDERLARVNLLATLVKRPDLGALVGAVAVFFLFAWTARGSDWLTDLGIASQWTDQAAQYGIVAVPVALLMIGGEFDLSAGVMIGSSGLLLGVLTTREDLNIWPAIVVVLLFGDGDRVHQRLHRRADAAAELHRDAGDVLHPAGRERRRHAEADGHGQHQRHRQRLGLRLGAAVLRLVGVVAVRLQGQGASGGSRSPCWARCCLRARASATGSSPSAATPTAARNVGVPVARTKIALFMMTSTTAALLGIITAIELRSIQANEGVGREFIFIIAAVVGGCLLTGGYGSVIGSAFGAAILGMASIGIILSQWDSNWVYAFQGVILMLAVMLNAAIRSPRARRRGHDERRCRPPARDRGDLQVLRQRRRAEGHLGARRRRRGHLRARRQRRGQVELHQDPLGRPPARRGRGCSSTARR